jgi:hypothetical protein
MPHPSRREELLHAVDQAALSVAKLQHQHLLLDDQSTDFWSDSDSDTDSLSSTSLGYNDEDIDMFSSPLSMGSTLSPHFSGLSDLSSDDSQTHYTQFAAGYDRLQGAITALRDEVERARILHRPNEPPPRAPQLHMLVHHEEHRPHLFRQKLRVNADIFDDILDQISDHHIFHNQSTNPQLPIAIQLAIFLNRAGHYGNAISLEDVAQWAGVSVGSVVNCTHRVMIALLEEHDRFISFPAANSEDAELARQFAESRTCPEWRGGFLAIDGSTIDLFAKPAYFGETFYDRKSKYSLGCQVRYISLFS